MLYIPKQGEGEFDTAVQMLLFLGRKHVNSKTRGEYPAKEFPDLDIKIDVHVYGDYGAYYLLLDNGYINELSAKDPEAVIVRDFRLTNKGLAAYARLEEQFSELNGRARQELFGR